MNKKVHVAYNFKCIFKNEVLLKEGLCKVTGSHVHCKCGNILGKVLDGVVVTRDH